MTHDEPPPDAGETTEHLMPRAPEAPEPEPPEADTQARRRNSRLRWVFYASLIATAALWWQYNRPGAFASHLTMPPGFTLAVFAEDLTGARSLAEGANGTIFVGTRDQGQVTALRDVDGDGRADERWVIAADLVGPNGVVFHQGDLYVAERHRIIRYVGIEARLDNPPAPEVIYAGLPTESHHGWRYMRLGPDGALYFGIGAPCNVCLEADPRFATIMRLALDSLGLADSMGPSIWAHGVRNTLGFDWHPGTRDLWFTDNGRDWLGDDVPPEELNRSSVPGLHFGFPYCHGQDIADPDFGVQRTCGALTPPVFMFGAHTAPLGMTFYRGSAFPEEYRGDAFVAQHGSWNRSTRVGYRLVRVHFEGGTAVSAEPFIEGWLRRRRVSGRPVDVLELRDGSLLVSDDAANAVYRVTWEPPPQATP